MTMAIMFSRNADSRARTVIEKISLESKGLQCAESKDCDICRQALYWFMTMKSNPFAFSITLTRFY